MTTQRTLLITFTTSMVAFLCLAAYWPGLYGPFFLDDLQSITPAKMDTFSLRSLLAISLQNDTGPLGRPLSVATFALNSYFFGDSPFGFKAVNLGLHLIVGLAVGFFIYWLIKLLPKGKRLALPTALIVSFWWLLHPLNVSTVLYPVQRMTQLCHLFTLMGLTTYLVGRAQLISQKPRAYWFMGLSFALFFPLSIFSKETGILFIWYLFCIEYFILDFKAPKAHTSLYLRRFHYTLSLSLVLAALIYYWFNLTKYLSIFAEKNLSIFERLLTETKVMILYLKLILVPQISDLGLYHDDFPISHSFDVQVIISIFILFFCGWLIYSCRHRAKVISFGLSWFFVSQAIESTIIPLEIVFEHRNYLASIGLLVIPSFYFVYYYQKATIRFKNTLAILLVTMMSLLAFVTYQRSYAWSTPQRFLTKELYHHPYSARVHIELANWFLTKGLYDSAFKELDIAQSLEPFNAGITLHKILIYCHGKNVPNELYDEASIKIRQGTISPYVILVLDQMVDNMFKNNCDAIDKNKLQDIIHEAQNNPFLWYKPLYKAVLFHLEGGLALLQKNVDQSRYLLNKSFEVYPNRIDPLIQKAYLELQHGMLKEAKQTISIINAHSSSLKTPSDKVAKLIKTMNLLSNEKGKTE
ncbi:MAG: hypothetical protein JSS07_03960 [Proteobacteria bacterium]|nr:hypothetical protein [Pseudomonadota bacterium]